MNLPNDYGGVGAANMTFLQKFAVHTSSKRTSMTTTTTERSILQGSNKNTVTLNGEKSKSVDELSADDELDDYLENVSFPV